MSKVLEVKRALKEVGYSTGWLYSDSRGGGKYIRRKMLVNYSEGDFDPEEVLRVVQEIVPGAEIWTYRPLGVEVVWTSYDEDQEAPEWLEGLSGREIRGLTELGRRWGGIKRGSEEWKDLLRSSRGSGEDEV